MSTGTGIAEDNFVEGEFVEEKSLVVQKQQAALSVRHEISPAQFKAEIENRKELKNILLSYVKSELQEGHHFYYASKFGKDASVKPKDGEKPSLNKEGALNVCHTLRCFPGKTDFEIIRHDDGHITVYADANIFNADGVMIATGRGSCSSRESKYRYRWCYDKDVPRDLDKNLLQSRSGQGWKQYRIENADIADLENTIIKMADKRAMKGAVDKLPIVSDIFAPGPDPDDLIINETDSPAATQAPQPARTSSNQPKPAQSATSSEQAPSMSDEDVAVLRRDVSDLLNLKHSGDADEIAKYLNGRNPDVMLASALQKMKDDLAAL